MYCLFNPPRRRKLRETESERANTVFSFWFQSRKRPYGLGFLVSSFGKLKLITDN